MGTHTFFRFRFLEKNRTAFTLVELLVVISIIAILVTIASASYSTVQKKTRDNRRKQDLRVFQQAMEQFYINNDSSYTDVGVCSLPTSVLQSIPSDPRGTPYPTPVCSDDQHYCLCVELEVDQGNSTTSCVPLATSAKLQCIRQQQ